MSGITDHLDDASPQQFVNAKTQRPLIFSYRAYPFEGNQIGIVHIPLHDRPFYLVDRFGPLERRVVYIRRSSSTGEALPDEVLRMGLTKAEVLSRQAIIQTDPKKTRLQHAMANGEKVIVIIWQDGRNLAMRSTPVECSLLKVTDLYAKFQPSSGGTISRSLTLIELSETNSGQLQADLY